MASAAASSPTAPPRDSAFKATVILSRVLIYGALILWAFICLFPIYWTLTTSLK